MAYQTQISYVVTDFGVVGNGSNDDTPAFQDAIDAARAAGAALTAPPNLTIRLTYAVDMVGLLHARIESKVVCDWTALSGAYITAGSNSASLTPCRLYFCEVTSSSGGIPTQPLLRLVGLKRGDISVDSCPYVQLYADASDPTISSIAYSHFHWGKIDRLELYGQGSGQSWINENLHIGGRFRYLYIGGGGYKHNGNVFYKPCIEGDSDLIIDHGYNNYFLGVRSENGLSIDFGAGTFHNVVLDHFVSNQDALTGSAAVTDSGTENFYLSPVQQNLLRIPLISLTKDSKITQSSSELPGATGVPTPGFNGLAMPGGWPYLVSQTIPTDVVKRFLISSDAALFRPIVYCYDTNMQLISPSANPMRTYGGWTVSGSSYTFNTNVSGAWILLAPDVKYITLQIRNSAAGTCWYLAVEGYRKITDPAWTEMRLAQLLHVEPYQTAAPTRGFSNVGDRVSKAGGVFVCTATARTTLAAASATGTNTLTLASGSGMANGDLIGIEQDDGTTKWTSISTGGGTVTITIASALTAAAAAGRNVFTARWV